MKRLAIGVATLSALVWLANCGSTSDDEPVVTTHDGDVTSDAQSSSDGTPPSDGNASDAMITDAAKRMSWISLSADKSTLVDETGKTFVPYGFNYDHDWNNRQLEDYWVAEWSTVEADFAEMRTLGATTVRIHLDIGVFMSNATTVNTAALDQLDKLLALAESNSLYLDLTGLANYRSADVFDWYDNVSEAERWAAQAVFWKAIATRGAKSPAVLGYDLLNEPSVPAAVVTEWRFGKLGTNLYGQYLTRDPAGRTSQEIAKAWMHAMYAAIRTVDTKHLVTVGCLPFNGGPFAPANVVSELDYLSVHIYPTKDKVPTSVALVKAFASNGRPVVIEETYPLSAGTAQQSWFMRDALPWAHGYLGFYWGKSLTELTPPVTFGDAIMRDWLLLFVDARAAVVDKSPASAQLNEFVNTGTNDRLISAGNASAIDAAWTKGSALGKILAFNTGDAVPLCEFYNAANTDHRYDRDCATSTATDAGYPFVGVTGWAFANEDAGRVPLHRYYSPTGTQHLYTLTRDDARYTDAGFQFERVEAYVLP